MNLPLPPDPVPDTDQVLLCRAFDRAREHHAVWHHFMSILWEREFIPEEPSAADLQMAAAIGEEYREAVRALDEAFDQLCAHGVGASHWAKSLPGGFGEPAGAHVVWGPGRGRLREASLAEEYQRQRVLATSAAARATGVTYAPLEAFLSHGRGGWTLLTRVDRESLPGLGSPEAQSDEP